MGGPAGKPILLEFLGELRGAHKDTGGLLEEKGQRATGSVQTPESGSLGVHAE